MYMYVKRDQYTYVCIHTYIYRYIYIYTSMYIYVYIYPPTDGITVHERVDSRFLVLPGSELTITEITEYTYFSPCKPCHEFIYKSELNSVPMDLIIETILFLWNMIVTFYYTRVRPQCDYSILGQIYIYIYIHRLYAYVHAYTYIYVYMYVYA